MAVELGAGYISLVASGSDLVDSIQKELGLPLSKAAQDAGEAAGKKLSGGILSNAQDTGKKLVEALGLVALGAAAFKSATNLEDANNIIARSTGATGKALDGLETSFRNVASGSAASFETISTTLAELNQRTGLTGKALEGLTSEVVSFNRITKDSPITVQSLTQALAGFNVPGKAMGTVLDHLFVISQKTGVPLASLLDTLNTAGPIARQFGFSVEFTAGLLGQLNKAGVDANSILPGLKKVFKDAADAGKDPAKALRDIIGQMDALVKAGDRVGAQQLAVQVFGARGVGLVDAAVAGKLSLESLNQTIDVSGSGILDTAKKTGTLSGALGILKNNAQLALAQFATPAIAAANELLRSLLPTVRDLGSEFAALPTPVKLTAAGLVGIASLAGPLGNLAQGAEGISNVIGGLRSRFADVATDADKFGFSVGRIAEEAKSAGSGLGSLGTSGFAAGLGLGSLATSAGVFVLAGTAVAAISYGIVKALDLGVVSLDRFQRAGRSAAGGVLIDAQKSADAFKTITAQRAQIAAQLHEFDAQLQALGQRGANAVTDNVDSIRSVFAGLGKEGEKNGATFLKLRQEYDDLGVSADKLKPKHEAAREAFRLTKDSLDKYNSSVAAGASETSAFAGLTDEAKKAVIDFHTAILAASDADLGRGQALRNVERAQNDQTAAALNQLQAQDDYNKALRDFGPASKEAFDASLKLAAADDAVKDAALNLEAAQDAGVKATEDETAAKQTLIDQIKTLPGFYDSERAKLVERIAQGGPLVAAYQRELDKLDEAKAAVDRLPVEKTTRVTMDTSQFDAAMRDIFDQLAALPTDVGFAAALTGGAGFARPTAIGGIFTTPQVRLIAEAGDEAVIPLNDPVRAFGLLAQSGLFDKASIASLPGFDVRNAAGPLVGQVVIQSPTPDPIRHGFDVARTLRAAQFLAA